MKLNAVYCRPVITDIVTYNSHSSELVPLGIPDSSRVGIGILIRPSKTRLGLDFYVPLDFFLFYLKSLTSSLIPGREAPSS
jgi:hypothetical protein